MIPNRNKTLVGLPCVRIEADADPIPLSRATGIRQRDTWPSDLRGLSGPIPLDIPPARRSSERTRAIPRPSLEPRAIDKAVAAVVVMYAIAIGVAIGMWWS